MRLQDFVVPSENNRRFIVYSSRLTKKPGEILQLVSTRIWQTVILKEQVCIMKTAEAVFLVRLGTSERFKGVQSFPTRSQLNSLQGASIMKPIYETRSLLASRLFAS